MGQVIKREKNQPNKCAMCKTYEIGKPVYIYRPWKFKEDVEDMKICLRCAKREHGPKNKRPLPE